jgi:hypothetical protein
MVHLEIWIIVYLYYVYLYVRTSKATLTKKRVQWMLAFILYNYFICHGQEQLGKASGSQTWGRDPFEGCQISKNGRQPVNKSFLTSLIEKSQNKALLCCILISRWWQDFL